MAAPEMAGLRRDYERRGADREVGMTKEPRTREQLAEMVLKEARATGKCADLHSVIVLGPVAQGRSNWHIGTSSNDPNLVSAP